jgi:hypothetical protein
MEGGARVIIGRSFSKSVAIVQTEGGESQNPFERKDSSHIARKEFI